MHLRTLCLLVLIGLFFSTSFAQENKPAPNPSDETTSAKSNRDLKESVDLLTKEVKCLHEALDAAKISTSVYWVLVFLTLSLIVLWFGIQKTAGLASQNNLDKASSQLQQDMTQLPEKFNNHLQTSLNPVKTDLQTNLQTVRDIQAALNTAKNEIQSALTAAKTEIQGVVTNVKNDIQTTLTGIRGEVCTAKNDIQTSVQAVRAEVAHNRPQSTTGTQAQG
ncbi:MAG: hypothetical protein ACJ71U_05860 [Terriglobales bacterium]